MEKDAFVSTNGTIRKMASAQEICYEKPKNSVSKDFSAAEKKRFFFRLKEGNQRSSAREDFSETEERSKPADGGRLLQVR